MRKLNEAEKIVIKVGTSSITYQNGKLNLRQIDELAKIISDLSNSGKKIVLVSSGAISAGVSRLNLPSRPREIALKQAVACVGQNALMDIYNNFFARYGYNVGQMLLSKYIFDHEIFGTNAKKTLEKLWELGVIPIINENDSITADEIKLGDNDNLSSQISQLVNADLLIILSDIEGIYNKNPKVYDDAKKIDTITKANANLVKNLKDGSAGTLGTGGITTKLEAGFSCAQNGIDVVIASSKKLNVIYDILNNKNVGTLFPKQIDKKH